MPRSIINVDNLNLGNRSTFAAAKGWAPDKYASKKKKYKFVFLINLLSTIVSRSDPGVDRGVNGRFRVDSADSALKNETV